jgi:hypothetical protein
VNDFQKEIRFSTISPLAFFAVQPKCLTVLDIRRTQFHWLLNSMSPMALLFVRSVSRVAGATGSSLARRRASFVACARQGANVVVSVRGVQFLQRARLWSFIVIVCGVEPACAGLSFVPVSLKLPIWCWRVEQNGGLARLRERLSICRAPGFC